MVTKRHPKPAALHKYTEAEGDCKSTIKMVLDCKSSTTRDKIVFRKFPKKAKIAKTFIFGYIRYFRIRLMFVVKGHKNPR